MAARMCVAAHRSLALGMTTTPSAAKSKAPSHRAHTPSVRFSGMAISRPTSFVSARHTRRARSARATPTTPMIGSSVYMWAK
eukprot:4636671-Pleurochrysis_carterae.AAC.1